MTLSSTDLTPIPEEFDVEKQNKDKIDVPVE